MQGETRPLLAGALVLLVLGGFVAARLEVTTDIAHFLPESESDDAVRLAKRLATSELSRTMVLLVSAAGPAEATVVSREFEAALRAEPRVTDELTFLDAGPPSGMEEAIWRLYHPRRFAFLGDGATEVAARTTDAALTTAARTLKRKLALPLSTLVSRVAPGDPLLILPALFERMAGSREDGLRLDGGRFITEDGHGAVLFLGTRAPSFDSGAQRPFLAGVQAAFELVNARHGGSLTLAESGANRFSVRAEDAIKSDVRRVSIWSIVGLLTLFLGLFRSLRIVLFTLLVVGAGFLAGTAACLLLFGEVHGVTLAFGAALIGVSIDYTIHFYCHQTLAPHHGGPRRTFASIWPGLVLGAATTVVGFVALVVSSFPGLRQLAIFAASGITAALVATRVFLPALTPPRLTPTRACLGVSAAIERALASIARRRVVSLGLAAGVLLVAAAGIPRVEWNDDVADLNRLDADLVAEDAFVRDRVVRYEQRRFVVAEGDDEETALSVNDRVAAALDAARAAGELGGFRGVASLLPSAAQQRAVDAAVRSDGTLAPRMEAALAAEGFVVGAFAPFRKALEEPPPPPLDFDDLVASPLAPLVRPFRVGLGARTGVLTFLHDLRDSAALERRLGAIDGARLVDVGATFTRAYREYRARMTALLLLGLVAIVALVALRHRRAAPTIAACAPAFLAAAGTVGLLALLGVELNLLSLVALLMIVSMGVDYGVFLAETGHSERALAATHLAIVVAALSTILGFGLLASSDHPALLAIGSTAGAGVTLCLVLAPTVRRLLVPSTPSRPGIEARREES